MTSHTQRSTLFLCLFLNRQVPPHRPSFCKFELAAINTQTFVRLVYASSAAIPRNSGTLHLLSTNEHFFSPERFHSFGPFINVSFSFIGIRSYLKYRCLYVEVCFADTAHLRTQVEKR